MKELLTQVFIPSEQSDGIIFFSLIVLSFIGLCTVGSASMGTTVGNLFGLVMVIGKQAFFFFIGYIAMNLCSKKFNTDSVHSCSKRSESMASCRCWPIGNNNSTI